MADRRDDELQVLKNIESNTGYIAYNDPSEVVSQLETTNGLLREILDALRER
jgi:hypothetical protein